MQCRCRSMAGSHTNLRCVINRRYYLWRILEPPCIEAKLIFTGSSQMALISHYRFRSSKKLRQAICLWRRRLHFASTALHQLVVVGDQSSGKSSVLKASPIFPSLTTVAALSRRLYSAELTATTSQSPPVPPRTRLRSMCRRLKAGSVRCYLLILNRPL